MRKEMATILRGLTLRSPGFVSKGRRLFIAPVDQVLQGVCFEPSGFDKTAFYVTKFVMPLCVPSNYIYFTFGERMQPTSPNIDWKTDRSSIGEELENAINNEARSFLLKRATPLEIVKLAKRPEDIQSIKAVAYCQARGGRTQEAVASIDRLLALKTPEFAWEFDVAEQVRMLRAKLIDDPAGAQAQLVAWESETAEHLGLTKYRKTS